MFSLMDSDARPPPTGSTVIRRDIASRPPARSPWIVRALAGAVAALAAIPAALVSTAPDAAAATTQFRGVNWARAGDNFTGEPLVLYGLSSSDSYGTVRAK